MTDYPVPPCTECDWFCAEDAYEPVRVPLGCLEYLHSGCPYTEECEKYHLLDGYSSNENERSEQ